GVRRQPRAERRQLIEKIGRARPERRQLVDRHLVGTQGLPHQPAVDKLVEPTGEQVRSDPETLEKLAEASRTGMEIAQHQENPAIAHTIQRARDRTEKAIPSRLRHEIGCQAPRAWRSPRSSSPRTTSDSSRR